MLLSARFFAPSPFAYIWADSSKPLDTSSTPSIANVIHGDGFDNNLSGTAGIDLIFGHGGNDIVFGFGGDDRLEGGDGNDYLDGGSGIDTLFGGVGDDTYVADVAGDLIVEKKDEGWDAAFVGFSYSLDKTNIENVIALEGFSVPILTGDDGDNILGGNAGANTLIGGDGDDFLDGGAGPDILSLGAGRDTIRFAGVSSNEHETITDFSARDDTFLFWSTIQLPDGTLEAQRFVLGIQARDADDRIIYNQKTGALYVDIDGTGPFQQFLAAILTNHEKLSAEDFTFLGT